ncbi:MAG: hypothetical protein Q7R95_07555 [bacterium]|nr:hypothetical protein [bacterium]
MKILLKNTVWILMVILVITNISLFVSGIKLGDNITFFELETRKLHEQNVELEKKVSALGSLQYAVSIADSTDFTKKAVPVYLEGISYAMNR